MHYLRRQKLFTAYLCWNYARNESNFPIETEAGLDIGKKKTARLFEAIVDLEP